MQALLPSFTRKHLQKLWPDEFLRRRGGTAPTTFYSVCRFSIRVPPAKLLSGSQELCSPRGGSLRHSSDKLRQDGLLMKGLSAQFSSPPTLSHAVTGARRRLLATPRSPSRVFGHDPFFSLSSSGRPLATPLTSQGWREPACRLASLAPRPCRLSNCIARCTAAHASGFKLLRPDGDPASVDADILIRQGWSAVEGEVCCRLQQMLGSLSFAERIVDGPLIIGPPSMEFQDRVGTALATRWPQHPI